MHKIISRKKRTKLFAGYAGTPTDMLEFKKRVRTWIPKARNGYFSKLVEQMPIVFSDRSCGHYVDFIDDSKQNIKRFLNVIREVDLNAFNIEEKFYQKI